MSNFKLTQQQISFFHNFGYLSFPDLMADRIREIDLAFEELWSENGYGHNGQPHDGLARSCLVPFIDLSETLSSLLDDPRILGIASSLLGEDFNYMGSDGNYYVGNTGWHSDGWHEEILHIKIAFYLDNLTSQTGCLRVIPGSHKFGDDYANLLSKQVGKSQELLGVEAAEVPCVNFETKPGDIVCFNHNLKHAAFGGGSRRRMFTMNCSQRYPDNRLDELRNYISGGARFWLDRAYGEAMIRTADQNRMRHLEQKMANDGHLAELSRQARTNMSEPSRG